jgi:WD40 repeat protein
LLAGVCSPVCKCFVMTNLVSELLDTLLRNFFGNLLSNFVGLEIGLRWQVINYENHTNNVTAVGFQCDGKWMYSGSEDGTVKIWDLRYSFTQSFCFVSLNKVIGVYDT